MSAVATWTWTLGLAGFGVVADYYAPTIFVGHSLVMGIVFYWVALRLVGPNRALVVLLAGAGTLTFKWDQPYSAAVIAFEGLCVGWAWRRRFNPLLADLVFWIALGTPLSWFLYRHIYLIPLPSLDYALAVQPINGLIAVWVAYLILEQFPGFADPKNAAPARSFQAMLLQRFIAFGTFPVLAMALIAVRSVEQRTVSEARDNLRSNALHLAGAIETHVTGATTAVREIAARQTDAASLADSPWLQRELEAVRARTGFFITMLAADATGRVVATASGNVPAAAPAKGSLLAVNDRDYFSEPMRTGQPYTSGVFRGRGFGTDLLIAVSAPVVNRTGERLGVIEGSLKVSTLEQLIHERIPPDKSRAVLADRGLQVIAQQGFDFRPLSSLAETNLGQFIRRLAPAPARLTSEVGPNRVSFLTVSVPLPRLGWSLTLQRPWGDVLRPIVEAYAWSLLIALVTAAIASLFTTWSLRDILRALRDLTTFSRAPTVQSRLLEDSARSDLPLEFRELVQNLSQMAQRLESEQQKREQLLVELESRVRERTRELESALVLAQTADRAKSAFLATVSHELRTPLTSIITGVRLLQLSPAPRSPLEERTLTALAKSSHVLMTVISDVLDYSKLEAGGLEIDQHPFRPTEVVADVVTIMDSAAKRAQLTLQAENRHDPGLTWVGDMPRVKQVLLNLTSNAVKFTASGSVSIACWVSHAEAATPARLCLSVTDTGPGIPADRVASIFEPFVQLETNRVTSQAGTGLGLSISRRLVEKMGGQLTVTSRLGEGSRFEFWLPAATVTAPTPPV